MSILTRQRRPRPWIRFNRADYEHQLRALEIQRDLALGRERATRDWTASWLEQSATAFREDAAWLDRLKATPTTGDLTAGQRRAIADTLHQLAIDFETTHRDGRTA